LAAAEPERIRVIDATAAVEIVQAEIWKGVASKLVEKGTQGRISE
jgi:thymidylate kinase